MSPKKISTYCFDIDGTLCSQTEGDYENAEPITERIEIVNQLAGAGHTIKLFTARGANSGLDLRVITESQVRRWGIIHSELLFGKPHADFFIDDKGREADMFFARGGLV